jgi:hypothetical protein
MRAVSSKFAQPTHLRFLTEWAVRFCAVCPVARTSAKSSTPQKMSYVMMEVLENTFTFLSSPSLLVDGMRAELRLREGITTQPPAGEWVVQSGVQSGESCGNFQLTLNFEA